MRPRRVELNDEAGAVAAFVAVTMVVLIGVVALAVDFGAMYVRRRAIVNANDAASLAAALSCARLEGQGAADAQAYSYAAANDPDAAVTTAPVYDPNCDAPAGQVTVSFEADQEMFFAPILGIETQRVATKATAIWGAAGGAENVLPMMLSMDKLSTCDVPDGVEVGDKCYFYWNNHSDLGNAEWGLMNLDKWGIAPTGGCSNAGFNSYRQWIRFGFPDQLVLGDPPPTYVCRDSGSFGGALNTEIEYAIEHSDIVYMPVNDPSQQVDSGGSLCPPPDCTADKYAIVGFAALDLTALYAGNSDKAQILLYCGVVAADVDPNSRCLETTWMGFQTGGIIPGGGGGGNFGLIAIGLGG
jgi:hypothetical protein